MNKYHLVVQPTAIINDSNNENNEKNESEYQFVLSMKPCMNLKNFKDGRFYICFYSSVHKLTIEKNISEGNDFIEDGVVLKIKDKIRVSNKVYDGLVSQIEDVMNNCPIDYFEFDMNKIFRIDAYYINVSGDCMWFKVYRRNGDVISEVDTSTLIKLLSRWVKCMFLKSVNNVSKEFRPDLVKMLNEMNFDSQDMVTCSLIDQLDELFLTKREFHDSYKDAGELDNYINCQIAVNGKRYNEKIDKVRKQVDDMIKKGSEFREIEIAPRVMISPSAPHCDIQLFNPERNPGVESKNGVMTYHKIGRHDIKKIELNGSWLNVYSGNFFIDGGTYAYFLDEKPDNLDCYSVKLLVGPFTIYKCIVRERTSINSKNWVCAVRRYRDICLF